MAPRRILLLCAAAACVLPGVARAACPQSTVPIRSLTAGFQAWKSITAAMAECGNFRAELDQEFAAKQKEALAANPALYQVAGVSADSIVAVLDSGTLRPLDDLLAKYGQSLSPNQVVRLNGKVYAIAMMVNAQNLLYRADILDQLGIPVPKTYDEVLAAAQRIKESGLVPYPLGATTKSGWNLGLEFVNMYLGFGGELFGPDNRPAVRNERGVKALEMLKRLTAYMDPEYLTADSTVVQQQLQQGRIAMANLWASRAGAMDDPAESRVVGKVRTAAAPAAVPGGKPATTTWWDGAAIARNTTDEQAEAAFRLVVHGMSPATVAAHNDDAVWLIPGYKPGRLAEGAIASMQAGAPPYPVAARMGLIHAAAGNNLAAFLTGQATADQTLAAIEAAYATRAREAGVLR